MEGNINRLKFIRRQMFGRAKFDLLRKRVLLAVDDRVRCHAEIQERRA